PGIAESTHVGRLVPQSALGQNRAARIGPSGGGPSAFRHGAIELGEMRTGEMTRQIGRGQPEASVSEVHDSLLEGQGVRSARRAAYRMRAGVRTVRTFLGFSRYTRVFDLDRSRREEPKCPNRSIRFPASSITPAPTGGRCSSPPPTRCSTKSSISLPRS